MKPIKKMILLHDLCGVGKAALTNMMPILSVLGVEACPVPTMLLSTHTGAYGQPSILKVAVEYVKDCADHYVRENITFDAVFVGYIGSEAMIDAVLYFISKFPETPVFMDPIMGDNGQYYSNFNDAYGQALKRLIPHADILLPNFTECCFLTNTPFSKECPTVTMKHMCAQLHESGAGSVIVTSVPMDHYQKGIVLYEHDTLCTICYKPLPMDFHGSGDVFDAVFAGYYLLGESLKDAVEMAHKFVNSCMKESARYQYLEREGLLIEKNLHLLMK